MPHPPPKPRPNGSLAATDSGKGGRHWSRLILGRRLSKKNATSARAEVRRSPDGERLSVQGSFLKPRGVIGDENERAETDLVALSQFAAGNHDDDDR